MSDQNALIKLSVDQFVRTADSSQRKKTATKKLVKEYGPVLNHFNDVVFITDEEGYFVFVNKASEQNTGVPPEIFIGRHFTELVDPKYHEFAKSNFQKVLNGEKIVPAIEMERQTASGEKITKEVNWRILSGDNGETFVMGVSRDVTDRKHAQEELKRARDELEMRVKERTADLQKANELLKEQISERMRAEEKLKESEEKYRGLFENSGDAVFIVDIETGIILDATAVDDEYVMMGFTFAPPSIRWGLFYKEQVCFGFFGCLTLFESKIGYDFGLGVGFRLPMKASVSNLPDGSILAEDEMELSTFIEPDNFSVQQYQDFYAHYDMGDAAFCERFAFPDALDSSDGDELAIRLKTFAGLKVVIVGIPLINWGVDVDMDMPEMCSLYFALNNIDTVIGKMAAEGLTFEDAVNNLG